MIRVIWIDVTMYPSFRLKRMIQFTSFITFKNIINVIQAIHIIVSNS